MSFGFFEPALGIHCRHTAGSGRRHGLAIIRVLSVTACKDAGNICLHCPALGDKVTDVVHVENARGRVITSRSHPRFLGHKGSLSPRGKILVDGRPWDSPEVAAEVKDIAGPGARLVPYDGAERFDVLPLLVATDGAIAAFGHDGRRLRPNIVIGGVEGLSEREWPGACLRIGKVLIGVQDLRQRCIMTSYDPDTQVQDQEITRGIYQRFGGKLALNRFIIEGGEIRLGDEVQLVQGRSCAGPEAFIE